MENKNEFLPSGYDVPKASGNYLKLEDGDNTIRVLGSAVVGWEGWVKDEEGNRKPERFPMEEKPTDLREFEKQKLSHFWAFPVYNVEAEKIQIFEVTQKTIQNAIKALVDNPKWGDPKEYDITITKSGEKLETKYSVVPNPKEPLDEKVKQEYEEITLDINKLFTNEDPFGEEE